MQAPISRRRVLATGSGLAAAAAVTQVGGTANAAERWESRLVRTRNGRLVYTDDADRHRIPDFGHSGYAGGLAPIPKLPVVKAIRPIGGDNTAHIQAALDEIAARPVAQRGALLLRPGVYPVAGTLHVRSERTVLRGSGDGADPTENTIIKATGESPPQRTVIFAGGSTATGSPSWSGRVPDTTTEITTDYVPVAARSFEVADPSGIRPGDNIIIVHPCSLGWLEAIDFGGADNGRPWEVDELPIPFNRYVRDVSGRTVTIDAPIFNQLDRSLTQLYLYRWDRAGLVRHVGVEKLRVDIEYTVDEFEDGDHARIAIRLHKTEDSWVTDCTALHFSHAGVETWGATRCTVRGVRALDPISSLGGGRRYNFNAYHLSQNNLFTGCHATRARHAYVSNGTSTVSGIVFHRSGSEGTFNSSEGHRRWSQGMLFDGHRESDTDRNVTLGLYYRGSWGTSHGWSAAHSVAWNCDLGGTKAVIQRPPTSQNYAIGVHGTVNGDGPFTAPTGYIEGTDRAGLFPASLYEAQVQDRRQRGD